MLVISRKRNTRTTITTQSGEVIELTVVDVRADRVRLGLECDKAINIVRDDAIQREREGE